MSSNEAKWWKIVNRLKNTKASQSLLKEDTPLTGIVLKIGLENLGKIKPLVYISHHSYNMSSIGDNVLLNTRCWANKQEVFVALLTCLWTFHGHLLSE